MPEVLPEASDAGPAPDRGVTFVDVDRDVGG